MRSSVVALSPHHVSSSLMEAMTCQEGKCAKLPGASIRLTRSDARFR